MWLTVSLSVQSPPMSRTLVFRFAHTLTRFFERFLPDAFGFALAALLLAAALGWLWGGANFSTLAKGFGQGFFSLLAFTLQMSLMLILGHAIAGARSVSRLLAALSGLPKTAHGAVVWVGFLAMLTSWLNWAFSLLFSGLLAQAVARRFARQRRRVDYKALAAASFLGLGSIWAQGLSGSAALQMASKESLPLGLAGKVIPLSQTIFLWQSLVSVAVEVIVISALLWWIAPREAESLTAADLGLSFPERDDTEPNAETEAEASCPRPGDVLERSRLLTLPLLLLGGGFLWQTIGQAPSKLAAVSLNAINLTLLLVATLLHKTPMRLQRAFGQATPAVAGLLLQFPFYGGIAGMLAATGLSERIASLFVGVANRATLPPLVALYSAFLGVFVPSGGSKWLIEAPYVLAAAERLHVHPGWMVATYDLGEALANLVQPFWMLPLLGPFRLKARDVMGYTTMVFLVLCPLVLFLTYVLGQTLLPAQ